MAQLPIFGTTTARVHVGRALHRVPTEVVFAGLREDCAYVMGKTWYACVLLEDGSGVLRGHRDLARRPAQDVVDKMVSIATKLNAEAHHDGHWVVGWADARLHMFWRDADGDLQFCGDCNEPWQRIRNWPDTMFAELAEGFYKQWVEHMRAAERKEGEMYRRALGEAAPSKTQH
jgi:hypothetical protein